VTVEACEGTGVVKSTLVGAAAGLLLAIFTISARADDAPNQARDAPVRDQKNLMTMLGAFALGSSARMRRCEVPAAASWRRAVFSSPSIAPASS
jgi:hypothetical protein